MESPFANTPPRRIDQVIQSVREQTERRDAQVWEGIPSGAAGMGAFDAPKDLRVAAPSTGSDAETWDREDQDEFRGVLLSMHRSVWDDATGQWVNHVRDLLFDARGMLVSVSAEVPQLVNQAEDCS